MKSAEWPEGVTPDTVRECACGLRLWQTEVPMPVSFRNVLMRYLDALWPPLAREHEEFKRKGGIL